MSFPELSAFLQNFLFFALIGTSDESLLHLHDALRIQFESMSKAYAEALNKLDQFCQQAASGSTGTGSGSGDGNKLNHILHKGKGLISKDGHHQHNNQQLLQRSPPVAQSHQRQLSLKASEIQERLIKNKSLLNAVEPTLEAQSLEVLLGILYRRIDLDKEVLFQFTQLKKEFDLTAAVQKDNSSKQSATKSVAPLLMKYQRGCQQVRKHHSNIFNHLWL